MGGELRILEHRIGALVLRIEQVLIGPLVVEREVERGTYPPILELVPAQIEDEGLGARGRFVAERLANDQPLVDGRLVVLGCPRTRGELLAKIVLAGEERLERDVAIAIVIDADAPEIVAPAVDRQVARPVIGDPLVDCRSAGFDPDDAVRPAAERRGERGLVELDLGVVCLRQHRQRGEPRRQVAVDARLEDKPDLSRAQRLGLRHVAIDDAETRVPFFHKRLEGKHHVGGGDRRAIVKLRARIEVEDDPAPVLRQLGGFRDQPIDRVGLVHRPRHQGIEHEARQLFLAAFEDEGIDGLVGSDRLELELAALGRVRIDVVELREAGRVF